MTNDIRDELLEYLEDAMDFLETVPLEDELESDAMRIVDDLETVAHYLKHQLAAEEVGV